MKKGSLIILFSEATETLLVPMRRQINVVSFSKKWILAQLLSQTQCILIQDHAVLAIRMCTSTPGRIQHSTVPIFTVFVYCFYYWDDIFFILVKACFTWVNSAVNCLGIWRALDVEDKLDFLDCTSFSHQSGTTPTSSRPLSLFAALWSAWTRAKTDDKHMHINGINEIIKAKTTFLLQEIYWIDGGF